MALSFKHLTSSEQISRRDVDEIFGVAADMEKILTRGGSDLLRSKILASLFYEPSTRTRLSFESAMLRLGGTIVTTDGLQSSSLYKGETIEDTMKMVSMYADIIAMRHPEVGSADRAAEITSIPFINAGDGPGQHPTQALLDLYTIRKECGKIDGLHIAMIGDLRYGRTVHSLSYLLGLYKDVHLTMMAPSELRMPENIMFFLNKKEMHCDISDDLNYGLNADVVYVVRVQQERFQDRNEYERLKLRHVITASMLRGKTAVVMHPLPRAGEIAADVDALSNAAYFRQAANGVPIRMALLAMLLNKV